MLDHGLFVEKYRPQTIEDCILPKSLKNTLRGIIKSGESQNLLLYGGAGVGKTTVAHAICRELNSDYDAKRYKDRQVEVSIPNYRILFILPNYLEKVNEER